MTKRRVGIIGVSIHAPLTGGDSATTLGQHCLQRFNPRPPHGRRHNSDGFTTISVVSIHAPLTGGDKNLACSLNATVFQSTPPSREATCRIRHRSSVHHGFNPRPPHGRRLRVRGRGWLTECFNPRPPHGRRRGGGLSCRSVGCFNPRPPHGRRLGMPIEMLRTIWFQSTPPSREATHAGSR